MKYGVNLGGREFLICNNFLSIHIFIGIEFAHIVILLFNYSDKYSGFFIGPEKNSYIICTSSCDDNISTSIEFSKIIHDAREISQTRIDPSRLF